MFGKRKREQERGRQVAAEAFPYLDEVLDQSLQVRAGAIPPDPDNYGVVAVVERLRSICGKDPETIVEVMERWWQPYDERLEEDEARSTAASAIFLGVALNGIGNLFGFIPPDAPSFDPALAAEGRARGWRQ